MKIFQREMRYWLILAFLAVAYFCTIVRSQGNWKTRESRLLGSSFSQSSVGTTVFPGRNSISFYLLYQLLQWNTALTGLPCHQKLGRAIWRSGLRRVLKNYQFNLWKPSLHVARSDMLISSNSIYVCASYPCLISHRVYNTFILFYFLET